MSDDNNNVQASDDVRAKVIETFEIEDNEDNSQLIDKLTNKEIESQKNLSKAIDQKVSYRDKAVKAGILDPNTFEPIEKKPEGASNKPNENQPGLSREDTIFFAQGGTEETYTIAKQIADSQGISVLAAKEDDYFKFQVGKINEAAQADANNMGSSNGSPNVQNKKQKPQDKMTREEHEAYVRERIG